ncbi:MAG: gliding motility-associated C-terminal domain-containing protein [Bacteroidota bacterium]
MHRPTFFTLFLLLLAYSTLSGQTFDGCITIDFEEIPGVAVPREGLVIDNQYFAQFGLSFILENGRPPVLAEVGSPVTAFGSQFGDGNDTPAPGQGIGRFFLTDDGRLSGLTSPPLILNFASPVDSFGGCILDMDFDEIFIIEARDASGTAILVDTIVAGQPGTGDGISTCWGFNLDGCEGSVSSIRFEGQRQTLGAFGLGLDNFSFCTTGIDIATQLDVESERLDCNTLTSSISITNLGSENYQYSIDGVNFQAEPFFDNLTPGTYTVTVIDEEGCDATWTILIDPYIEPLISNAEVTATICRGDNGAIVVTAAGSTDLEYSIDGINFQASNVFDNLPAGIYRVTVRDIFGCTTSQIETVDDSEAFEVESLVTIDDLCNNRGGSVTVTVSGGTGNLSYTLSSDPNSSLSINTFNGLSAGIYEVEVTDELGCFATDVFEIAPGIPILNEISPQLQNPNCFRSTGIITISNNGTNTFQYSLDGLNFQSSPVFENLPPDSYTVYIQDINNCVISLGVFIQDYEPLTILDLGTEHTTCEEDNGILTITPSANNGITYSLNGGVFQSENTFTGLPPSTYEVTISDADGCTFSTTATIAPSELPDISSIAVGENVCTDFNGTISVSASGGTGQLSYAFNDGPFLPENDFVALDGGIYTIQVQDEDGCIIEEEVEVINTPPILITDVFVRLPDCSTVNGLIRPTASGGTGQLFYSLDGSFLQRPDSFPELAEGTYELLITDEVGCEVTQQVVVPIPRCPIYIPNVFTPNDDGVNDQFQIFTTNLYDVEVLNYTIFDRWGEQVWESDGFTINTGCLWWDGTFRDEPMMTGVYVYLIRVRHLDGFEEDFSGDVTLIR